jgi:hypothetical protein
MQTTYTKLRDGSWGIRVQGAKPTEGSSVTVSKRDGTQKTETVKKVIWTDGTITLCSIGAASAPANQERVKVASRGRTPGCCSDCGARIQSWMDGAAHGLCHDCV